MAEPSGNLRCTITCWVIGLIAGGLAFVLLRLIGGLSWPGAIFTGGVVFVGLGALLSVVLCRPLPTLEEVQARYGAAPGSTDRSGQTGSRGTAAGETKSGDGSSAAQPAASRATGSGATVEQTASSHPPDHSATATASGRADTDPAEQPDPPGPVSSEPDALGVKPEMLSAPRGGEADNLKEIKGVGPKLEGVLNALGVYHFDQVASWTDDEIAWVDANLEGFKGRVSRDDWVSQAKTLASGGDTEFSKRVGDGGIY